MIRDTLYNLGPPKSTLLHPQMGERNAFSSAKWWSVTGPLYDAVSGAMQARGNILSESPYHVAGDLYRVPLEVLLWSFVGRFSVEAKYGDFWETITDARPGEIWTYDAETDDAPLSADGSKHTYRYYAAGAPWSVPTMTALDPSVDDIAISRMRPSPPILAGGATIDRRMTLSLAGGGEVLSYDDIYFEVPVLPPPIGPGGIAPGWLITTEYAEREIIEFAYEGGAVYYPYYRLWALPITATAKTIPRWTEARWDEARSYLRGADWGFLQGKIDEYGTKYSELLATPVGKGRYVSSPGGQTLADAQSWSAAKSLDIVATVERQALSER